MKKPIVAPDVVRAPKGKLPDLDAPLDVGFEMTQNETEAVRMGMWVHSASRKPVLLWPGWHHVAVAVSIGAEKALKAAGGNNSSPLYRRVMTEFLRRTGFIFLNKNDRAAAVRMLPQWDEIGTFRSSLSPGQQRNLNNPREVEAAFKDRKGASTTAGKPRHGEKQRRKLPTPTETYLAMVMELELANERRERAEREAEYFASMADEFAKRGRLSPETMAEIRTKVRAELEAMTGEEEAADE
jgi:hypothetical protein